MTSVVLVVTTQARNGSLLRDVLTQNGYDVVLASSWEAWQKTLLQTPRIALVLVDGVALGADVERGYALLRERGIPFVVIVPRWEARIEVLALHHGARGMLVKPLDIPKFLAMMHEWLPPEPFTVPTS